MWFIDWFACCVCAFLQTRQRERGMMMLQHGTGSPACRCIVQSVFEVLWLLSIKSSFLFWLVFLCVLRLVGRIAWVYCACAVALVLYLNNWISKYTRIEQYWKLCYWCQRIPEEYRDVVITLIPMKGLFCHSYTETQLLSFVWGCLVLSLTSSCCISWPYCQYHYQYKHQKSCIICNL